jgi:hypothetical protein
MQDDPETGAVSVSWIRGLPAPANGRFTIVTHGVLEQKILKRCTDLSQLFTLDRFVGDDCEADRPHHIAQQ